MNKKEFYKQALQDLVDAADAVATIKFSFTNWDEVSEFDVTSAADLDDALQKINSVLSSLEAKNGLDADIPEFFKRSRL